MSGCTAYAGIQSSERPRGSQFGVAARSTSRGCLSANLLRSRHGRCGRRGPSIALLAEIRACTRCAAELPLGPRPVVRGRPSARLLIISQAPGTRVHETGLSFNDRSGDRLREWLGIDRESFTTRAGSRSWGWGSAIPAATSRGGDLPPRPECAPLWHPRLRPHFTAVAPDAAGRLVRDPLLPAGSQAPPMAATPDRAGAAFCRRYFVLPHPSWRTTAWERRQPVVRAPSCCRNCARRWRAALG